MPILFANQAVFNDLKAVVLRMGYLSFLFMTGRPKPYQSAHPWGGGQPSGLYMNHFMLSRAAARSKLSTRAPSRTKTTVFDLFGLKRHWMNYSIDHASRQCLLCTHFKLAKRRLRTGWGKEFITRTGLRNYETKVKLPNYSSVAYLNENLYWVQPVHYKAWQVFLWSVSAAHMSCTRCSYASEKIEIPMTNPMPVYED